MKKIEMVFGGVELLATLGVSVLMGGVLVLVTPTKLGIIKKLAVSVAGFAITCMVTDAVTSYMDKEFKEFLEIFKDISKKKEQPKEIAKEET